VKNSNRGDENLGAKKPLSPSVSGKANRAHDPSSPCNAKGSPDKGKAPSPATMEKTPKATKPLRPVANEGSFRSNRAGTPKKSPTPSSPQSHGLGVVGRVLAGGDSA
jgi:hypothetical protein